MCGESWDQTLELYEVSGSSTISKLSYDNLMESMTVDFKPVGKYMYVGVPKKVFLDMCSAESVGKFFHANVRKQYEFFNLTGMYAGSGSIVEINLEKENF